MSALGVMVAIVCREGRRKHMFTHRGSGVRLDACIHCGAPNEGNPKRVLRVRPAPEGSLLELAQAAVRRIESAPPVLLWLCLRCNTKVDTRSRAGHAHRCGGTEHDFEPYAAPVRP